MRAGAIGSLSFDLYLGVPVSQMEHGGGPRDVRPPSHALADDSVAASRLAIRPVRPGDAPSIHAFVGAAGTLAVNSPYCYAVCTDHFRDTCVVAEDAGELAGLVIAFRSPARPDTLFVWQVGVAPRHRRAGLGARLLDAVFVTPGARGVRRLEATVTADNQASRALFSAFARRRGVAMEEAPGYVPGTALPRSEPEERVLRIVVPAGDVEVAP